MAQNGKSASLGRNPSSDFMKRRRSWQYANGGAQSLQPPDVRSFLGKHGDSRRSLRLRAAATCGAVPWLTLGNIVLATFAVLVTAGIILVVIAIASQSSLVYTQWTEVRDGTTFYVQTLDRDDAAILVATFVGAAIIVMLIYCLFSICLTRYEARQHRRTYQPADAAAGDLEQGDATLKTKLSITKLMSDAEKQYVAEYVRKSAPAGVGRKSDPNNDKISVQQLEQRQASSPPASIALGIPPPRSWSLKRMLSIGRSEAERQNQAVSGSQDSATSIDRGIPSAEVAAQLSSPDAFNRASSSHPNLADDKRRHLSSQDPAIYTPSTPTMGELMRQRRETFVLEGGTSPAGSTRIMVTKPVIEHGDGSASSDSEEEDYDRERQHSVLPHPAGDPPFASKILKRLPRQGLEDAGVSGSLGWQDVGLESDEEGSVRSRGGPRQPGHIRPEEAGLFPQASTESRPAEQLELQPASSAGPPAQAHCLLELDFEEVLPRPQAGLLNRLLRLARVERVCADGSPPAFVIQSGREYMVGLRFKAAAGDSRRLTARWIRIQPPDGQPVRFNVEEEVSKDSEWLGSACWDTTLHSSEALSHGSKGSADESIPLQVSIGLADAAVPGVRMEAGGTIHVMLQNVLQDRAKSGKVGAPSLSKTAAAAEFIIL